MNANDLTLSRQLTSTDSGQAARARACGEHVRMLLRQRYPGYAAALEAAIETTITITRKDTVMPGTDTAMTQDEAHALIAARDNYARAVYRMSRARLAALYRTELAERGMQLLYGGPASKDELTSAIMNLRYPLETMNRARQAYYAPVRGFGNLDTEAGEPGPALGSDENDTDSEVTSS